jgi:hypothetical protein
MVHHSTVSHAPLQVRLRWKISTASPLRPPRCRACALLYSLAADALAADGFALRRPCDVPRLHPGSRPPRQLHTATPKPTSKKTQTIAVGSKVELTTDYANYLDASSGPLKPGT